MSQEAPPAGMSTTAKVLTVIVLFAVAGLLVNFMATNRGSDNRTLSQSQVMYTAQSDGPIEVSYNNETNGMNHENWEDPYNAWSKVITPWPSDTRPYITAQSHSEGNARVVVQIFCDGALAQRSESHGPFTIATAIASCR